jgi:hypothetical protein
MQVIILTFLLTLPVFHEDLRDTRKREQLEMIAEAIATVSETQEDAAMLVATGYEESTFGIRYHLGQCFPYECDGGKARGPWQMWRANGMLLEEWSQMVGLPNTEAQALAAHRRLSRGFGWCGSHYGALVNYLGLPCDARGAKVDRRLDLYERALHAFQR